MKPKLETDKGWTEAIIDDDCEYGKFYKAADLLSNHFNLTFSNKLNDFDTLYWDFEYKGNLLILHYNIYLGISIFPKALKLSTEADNSSAIEISTLLFQKLIDLDWLDFENGKTLGTKGSEGGIIIHDIENSNGARVTLEKECGNIPFSITFGIYGVMFHTHFESDKNNAIEYVALKKNQINKVFELYDIEEEKRKTYWNDKHDKLMAQLTDMTKVQINGEQKKEFNVIPSKLGRKWWQRIFRAK